MNIHKLRLGDSRFGNFANGKRIAGSFYKRVYENTPEIVCAQNADTRKHTLVHLYTKTAEKTSNTAVYLSWHAR